jgi:hypothetical protein
MLAVLIPVRGAVAAAMLCPVAGVGIRIEMRLAHAPSAHHASMDAAAIASGHAHHDHAHHDLGPAGHDHGPASNGKCDVCSAFCSVTTMVGSPPTVSAPELASTTFPRLSAPDPSFLSGGQERPPRSI